MQASLSGILALALAVSIAGAAKAESQAEQLINKAKLGDTDAQLYLSELYRFGVVSFSDGSKVGQNIDEAERWLKEAAIKDLRGKLRLGGLYASSDFPRRDDRKAAQLWAEVARSSDADKDLIASAAEGLGEILYQECPGYLIYLDCGPDKTSPRQDYSADEPSWKYPGLMR